MPDWTRILGSRRTTAGVGLLAGGALVLGFWTVVGWLVPVLLLGIAIVLAWRHSALGVAAAVVGAGVLFWLGMAFGWIAWAVGLALLAAGAGLLVAGRGKPEIGSGSGNH